MQIRIIRMKTDTAHQRTLEPDILHFPGFEYLCKMIKLSVNTIGDSSLGFRYRAAPQASGA